MDVAKLSKKQLLDKNKIEEILLFGQEVLDWGNMDAKRLARNLETKLRVREDRPLSGDEKKYRVLIHQLQAASLFLYSDEDVARYFKDGIQDGLVFDGEPYVITDALDTLMIPRGMAERGQLKNKLLEALRDSEKRLTKADIRSGKTREAGTIKNWLRDYVREVGVKGATTIKQNEYLASSKNAANLSSVDRRLVRRLLGLYEWLQVPAGSLEGLHDSILFSKQGLTFDFNGGNIVPWTDTLQLFLSRGKTYEEAAAVARKEFIEKYGVLPGADIPADKLGAVPQPTPVAGLSPGDVQVRYRLSDDEVSERKAARDMLMKDIADNPQQLVAIFEKEVLPTTLKSIANVRIMVILSLLVEMKLIEEVLARKEITSTLHRWLQEIGETNAASNVAQGKAGNDTFQWLIRFVLEHKLHLEDDLAPREAVRLGNTAGEAGYHTYTKLAYFDFNKKAFVWA